MNYYHSMRLKNFSLNFCTQIFKSFSDEARVRILNLLFHHKELSISDLELILDFTQTKTSRHLIYLKNAGIVSYRKIDQRVFYSIKEEVIDLISRVFEYMNKDQILQSDLDIYNTLNSNRELAANKLSPRKLQTS